MASKRTAARTWDSAPAATPSTPSAPPLDSPEFDQLAKEWLEELIRRAKAKGRTAHAPGMPAPPPLTVRGRGEGAFAGEFCVTDMYDLRVDHLGLMFGLKEVSRDALEVAIREAGFNGWVAPRGPGMKGLISAVFDFPRGVSLADAPAKRDVVEVVH